MDEKLQKQITETIENIRTALGGLNGFLSITPGVRYYSNPEGDYVTIEFEASDLEVKYIRGNISVEQTLKDFFMPQTIYEMLVSLSLAITQKHKDEAKNKRQEEIEKLENDLKALKGKEE